MYFPFKTMILILVVIGVILLQIFLSKKESKWLGLILPIISFLYSTLAVAGYLAYNFGGSGNEVAASSFFPIISLFVYSNIPTVIFLLIYYHYKEKRTKLRELDKMNIQDLN